MKIIYSSLRNQTLSLLQENFKPPQYELIHANEDDFFQSGMDFSNASIIILGEELANPINLSQHLYSADSCISILLVSAPSNLRKLKQALLFTPFVGPTVFIVSSEAGKGLISVVEDHVKRTFQRRSFRNIKGALAKESTTPKQSHEKIKEEFINGVLEEAPIGIVLINEKGVVLSFNRHAGNILGVSEKQVLGRFFEDIFDSEALGNRTVAGSSFQGGTPLRNSIKVQVERMIYSTTDENETIKYYKDKEPVYLNIIKSNLKKEQSFKIVLISDVTKQILAQKAIEEEAEKINNILELMPDMAWAANPDGNIIYLNKRWYLITGQTKENRWQEAMHPEDLTDVKKKWDDAVKSGKAYQVECRYWNTVQKNYRWNITRATPLINKDGEITQWIGTCTDIHDLRLTQKKLQETSDELAAINEELLAANEEITASNEELQFINDRLIKVNSDLDNFIYTASHDLKAPITNIEGLVLFLSKALQEKNWLDAQLQKILEMINASISRFKRTITDLTEISKIQRSLDLEIEDVSIAEIVNEVLLDLEFQIKDSGARVDLAIRENATVLFSRKNLKSVVYNLISNAIKYRSSERKPFIKVHTSEDDLFFILTVKDNGLGFDMEEKNKIFSMFKRLHSHVEGTGIGLYMVKKILENADGTIEVDSEKGKGTTFQIYFRKNIAARK